MRGLATHKRGWAGALQLKNGSIFLFHQLQIASLDDNIWRDSINAAIRGKMLIFPITK